MDHQSKLSYSRRDFIKYSAAGAAALNMPGLFASPGAKKPSRSRVALFRTDNRAEGVKQVLKMIRFRSPAEKNVLIKPNFNTADPTPGSTHNDTLSQLVTELRELGASRIAVGDRSGPQPTADVLEKKGILTLSKDLDFDVINFSDLPEADWISFNPPGNHWDGGFTIARPIAESQYTVSTCCLKTHQYGGVFTMSLKNWVGAAPRSLMRQLHSSEHQRRMIAELNVPFAPEFVVMDGIEAFVDKGPMTGDLKTANVVLASTDRVAIDAVGVAILKHLGSNDAIMGKKIFEQEQIQRAVELGLGAPDPAHIEIVTQDKASKTYAAEIGKILIEG